MRKSKSKIAAFSAVVLSAAILLYVAPLAQARPGRGRGRVTVGRHIRGPARHHRRRHDRGRSGLTLGIGFSNTYCSHRQWVAGRWEVRTEHVLVEAGHHEWREEEVLIRKGHWKHKYVPAVKETVYDSQGRPHDVTVERGGIRKVWVPAKYEIKRVKVWVPGRYETRTTRHWVPGQWSSSGSCSSCSPSSRLRIGGNWRFRF